MGWETLYLTSHEETQDSPDSFPPNCQLFLGGRGALTRIRQGSFAPRLQRSVPPLPLPARPPGRFLELEKATRRPSLRVSPEAEE